MVALSPSLDCFVPRNDGGYWIFGLLPCGLAFFALRFRRDIAWTFFVFAGAG
jgi:hypothetical protein